MAYSFPFTFSSEEKESMISSLSAPRTPDIRVQLCSSDQQNGDILTIPESLLCICSSVFRAMLASSMKEGLSKTISFPETSPLILQYFVYFIMKVDFSIDTQTKAELGDILVRLLKFAQMYMIEDLSKKITKELPQRIFAVVNPADRPFSYTDVCCLSSLACGQEFEGSLMAYFDRHISGMIGSDWADSLWEGEELQHIVREKHVLTRSSLNADEKELVLFVAKIILSLLNEELQKSEQESRDLGHCLECVRALLQCLRLRKAPLDTAQPLHHFAWRLTSAISTFEEERKRQGGKRKRESEGEVDGAGDREKKSGYQDCKRRKKDDIDTGAGEESLEIERKRKAKEEEQGGEEDTESEKEEQEEEEDAEEEEEEDPVFKAMMLGVLFSNTVPVPPEDRKRLYLQLNSLLLGHLASTHPALHPRTRYTNLCQPGMRSEFSFSCPDGSPPIEFSVGDVVILGLAGGPVAETAEGFTPDHIPLSRFAVVKRIVPQLAFTPTKTPFPTPPLCYVFLIPILPPTPSPHTPAGTAPLTRFVFENPELSTVFPLPYYLSFLNDLVRYKVNRAAQWIRTAGVPFGLHCPASNPPVTFYSCQSWTNKPIKFPRTYSLLWKKVVLLKKLSQGHSTNGKAGDIFTVFFSKFNKSDMKVSMLLVPHALTVNPEFDLSTWLRRTKPLQLSFRVFKNTQTITVEKTFLIVSSGKENSNIMDMRTETEVSRCWAMMNY
eukprot:GCRY01003903.1.p1 GENE.GCRY01003903.1~~GCRY01003903.1.p1  ORF type:complete len:723 (-),score=146.73 GCRY01003903.1:41-2209(-)